MHLEILRRYKTKVEIKQNLDLRSPMLTLNLPLIFYLIFQRYISNTHSKYTVHFVLNLKKKVQCTLKHEIEK